MGGYITNQVLDHGMGSRILKILFLMGYANHTGNDFIFTPLTYEGDGVNFNQNQLFMYNPTIVSNHRDEYLELCERWDKTLNFNGLTIKDINRDECTKLIHPHISPKDMLNSFNGDDKIKKQFTLTKTKTTDYINVNVHIRRGDVTSTGHNSNRWLSDEYYLNIINDIESEFGDKCKITIHTQRGRFSHNFNYDIFSKYTIKYDDENLDNETWVELINSDILVMGLSSYSYSAAMLCNGIAIYTPEHNRLCGPKLCDNWILPNEIKNNLKQIYEKSINNGY